jgi:cytidine deaminase
MISAKVRRAHTVAKQFRKNAYAPYSKFKVGAALVTSAGEIFGGCNVENASYGGTVCAERAAILKAVSEGERKFSDIIVVTDADKPAVPCALCLQTMAEFLKPEARVWIANTRRIVSEHRFSELLPKPFGPRELSDAR